jgi:hypothetical protein
VLDCSFYTTQNLESTVLKQSGFGSLGFYLIGTLYLCYGTFSILSSAIFKRLGTIQCLVIGGTS